MARQPLSSTAPEPTGPATELPPVAPLGPREDPLVVSERRRYIDDALRLGASLRHVIDEATKRFRITEQQVRAVVTDLRRLMLEEDAEARPYRQLEQVQRLKSDVVKMRVQSKIPFAALNQHEKLIAEIEGNLAPRRIKHEIAPLPDALGQVIGQLGESEIERIIAEERELQKKLGAFITTADDVAAE